VIREREADGTSLLHGDPWSGNLDWTTGGEAPSRGL
jgi:hypothetical protein